MKFKNILARAATLSLLAIFLAYIGYQVVSNLSDQIVTIDALVITAEELISVEGMFARSQVLVYGEGGGAAEYRVADGQKAARGQTLALFFDSGSAVAAFQEIQEIESKIQGLELARRNLSSGIDSQKLDIQIYDQLRAVARELEAGSAQKAAGAWPVLRQLVVGRSAGAADAEAYKRQLDDLSAQRSALQKSLAGASRQVTAERSGYFFRFPDGYETVLTPKALADMTPAGLAALAPDPAVRDSRVVGTLVDSYEWYFVASLGKEQADRLKDRGTVEVYFPQISGSSLTVTLDSLKTYGDRALLILKSGLMQADYLSARQQPADLVAGTYTGIKVPREALRQVDGRWGVFCLEGAMARFKPVEWIYQTESYYLVKQAESADKGLYMFDQIIVKGRALEDLKVVR